MFGRGSLQLSLGFLAVTLPVIGPLSPICAQREVTVNESAKEADHWVPLSWLVGSWQGEIDGKLRKGRGMRRYEFVIGDQFLMCRHSSVRLPQEKSPNGDQHGELGVFSFDSERKTIIYREFLNEGLVVRLACRVDALKVVCSSEAVESGPGIRTRLTLTFVDRYRFVEVYEIGWPGKDMEHYFTIRWTRSPTLDDA